MQNTVTSWQSDVKCDVKCDVMPSIESYNYFYIHFLLYMKFKNNMFTSILIYYLVFVYIYIKNKNYSKLLNGSPAAISRWL